MKIVYIIAAFLFVFSSIYSPNSFHGNAMYKAFVSAASVIIVSALYFLVQYLYKKLKTKEINISFENIINNKTNLCYIFNIFYLMFACLIGFSEYGFYMLLRICVTLFSLYAANLNYNTHRHSLFVLPYILIAILFNPITIIELEVDTWETIDFFVAIFMTIDLFLSNHK